MMQAIYIFLGVVLIIMKVVCLQAVWNNYGRRSLFLFEFVFSFVLFGLMIGLSS